MFGRASTSVAIWAVAEQIDRLASRHEDGTVAVLDGRHTDDQYQTEEAETAVNRRCRS